MFISNLPSIRGAGTLLARRRQSLTEGDRLRLFGRGRQALAALTELIGIGRGTEVLLPASLCAEAIWPFLRAGASIRYYQLDSNLDPDTSDIVEKIGPRVRAVYVVHYYGMRAAIESVRDLCVGSGLTLIEDCALCLFDGIENGGVGGLGDYAVFSPWKFIPTPDGGVLTARDSDLRRAQIEPKPNRTTARFVAREVVHQIRQISPGFARPLASNDDQTSIDSVEDGLCGMAPFSRYVFERTDFAAVRRARIHNYSALAECVSELNIGRPLFPAIRTGSVPYSLPIVVGDAIELQNKLRARGVATEVSLSRPLRGHVGVLDATEEFRLIDELAPRVLSLPVHQSIGPTHLAFMAAALRAVR